VPDSARLLQLLHEHGARLHRLLYRLTLCADAADDLLQDLFLKLNSSQGFFRATNPAAYVWQSAVNLASDWRRSNARKHAELISGDLPAPDSSESLIEHREEFDRILDALTEVPELCRLCIVLRYVEAMDTDEIARRVNKTPHQVRALCAKGIAILRQRCASAGESAHGDIPK
jgi:RNA polymerase sigma-70 factor (ECF subfamily)